MTVLTLSLSCAGTFLYSIVPRHIVYGSVSTCVSMNRVHLSSSHNF